MAYTTKPGSKARVAEIMAEMAREGKLVIGFCMCPKPHGQGGKSLLRENILTGPSDLHNPAIRCLSCQSPYSAAGI